MTKYSKNKKDENEMAFSIIEQMHHSASQYPSKNPAAVVLGRLGGLKGGHARAKKLSRKRRLAIAKKAAHARWGKKT